MRRSWMLVQLMFAVFVAVAAAVALRPAPAAAAEAKVQTKIVQIDNFTFDPETLVVPVNTTVTWVNKDDIPHVIASSNGLFKSKALDTDDRYSFTFTKAGTYPYYCTVHPKMEGKIVVR
jgi:plastocyanin